MAILSTDRHRNRRSPPVLALSHLKIALVLERLHQHLIVPAALLLRKMRLTELHLLHDKARLPYNDFSTKMEQFLPHYSLKSGEGSSHWLFFSDSTGEGNLFSGAGLEMSNPGPDSPRSRPKASELTNWQKKRKGK